MPLNLINEYLISRIREFIAIMQDCHTNSDGKIIMTIFALQRCSLLFNFDYFADNVYTDYKLSALRNLANWTTIQTPLYIINIHQLKEITIYIICVFLWLIIALLLIQADFKRHFRNFFVFYQLIFVIPCLQIVIFHLHEGDYTYGLVSLVGVIVCYLTYCFIHRNYLLPQKNFFIRRYSLFNYILLFADVSFLILKFYVDEIYQTFLISILNFIYFIDAFLIQPYQHTINKKYVSASSLMLLISALKLLSFSMTQDKVFYFILLLSPLFTVVMAQIYTKYIYSSFLNQTLNFERLLIIADVLSFSPPDSILANSIIINLQNHHNIMIDSSSKNTQIQQIILSLLNFELEAVKHCNDVITIENVNLYKILYLFVTCKRAQLGYIELKSFQCNSIKQSFYFNQISLILQSKMGKKINQCNIQDSYKQLSLSDIRKAELLYEENIQNIVNILDTKIKFWLDLNKGYQKIEHLAENAINLSEKIWYLRDQFFTWFQISPLKLQSQLLHFNSLELKLLAVLHSAILNDYHSTLEIEQRIQEIMTSERNLQTDKINNNTLLNDELAIIATSFVKQPGFILNKNRGQLAKFFGYLDEVEFQNIGHIEQLMPTYIQQIHEKIISRYMKKGYSIMTEQSKVVFIKMKSNFISAVNISLLYMFEQDTDYIIHGVLQKVQQKQDFIIFDKLGKILGITEQIFNILGNGLKLDQLIVKGYVYFWFHNIFNEIAELKTDQFEQLEQFTKLVQKSQILYPITDFAKLYQEHDYTIVRSIAKHQETEDFLLIETNDLERINMLQSTLKTGHFFKEQSIQFMNDFVSKIKHLQIFDLNNTFQIKYSIQFHILGQDLLPVFILQINEIEKKRMGPASHTTGGQSNGSLILPSMQGDPFNDNFIDVQILDERFEPVNINPPVINKINQSQNMPDSRVEDIQQYQNCSIEQYNLISPRGNNKDNLINEDDDDYEEEKVPGQDNAKSSSQLNDINQKNIAQIFKENQKQEQKINFVFNNGKQSQSSVTTDRTQISVFNILKHLQYSTQYQTTLIKIFFNSMILILLLTCMIIVQLIIARNNTNTLQSQIPLIRIPDKFNRLYCTFAVIGQMDLEMKLLGINYGDYYVYRIKQEGNDVRPQMLALIESIKGKFSKYDQEGKLQEAEIYIINQYLFAVQNVSLIQFSEMANDYTQAINNLFTLDNDEAMIDEQIKLIFLKGNLISLINLISNLVENIVAEFFSNIDNYQLTYLIFLLLQLIIITLAVILQFKYWVHPYIYNQNILLLICRIPEKETEVLLQKYKIFKDFLQNEISKWKQTDYFKEFFTCRVSQLRKIQREKIQIVKKQKSANQRVTVNSRIQETQYSILPIYLMLSFFWALLTSFVISSYFFQSINVQNSHPELNLCMQFVRFKQEFDSCMIISQFIKNQPLLSGYQKESGIYDRNPEYNKSDGFFKTYTYDLIQQFQNSLSVGKQLYENIYDNIVASTKISQSNKNVLLGLYQDDLCEYIEDELPFCNYEEGKFKYFPNYPETESINNNRERLRQGFNGIYQQILSLFSSKYSKELNGIQVTDQDEIMQFLETPEYVQLLLPYFFDLNKAIVKFYATIITASVDILETDYQNYLAYYISYGVVAMLLFLGVVILKARQIQRQVRAIRQALVLLPHESLLDIQIYSAIKRFEQQM